MTSRWVPVFGLASASLLVACPSNSPELAACDPLAPRAREAVELQTLLEIGEADDGRLFVVDQSSDGTDTRLFIADGGELIQRGSGGSSRSDTGVQSLAISTSDDPRTTVIVERRGSETRMEVVTGEWDREWDLDVQQGEELEVRDESAIEGMTARKQPSDLRVEYLARVDGSSLLVVLSPEHDFNYEDFRVFFGAPERVLERELIAVNRGRDGGSTHVLFELGDEQADAFFPNRILGPNMIETEPVTFTVGGKSLEIEKLSKDAEDLDAASLECTE